MKLRQIIIVILMFAMGCVGTDQFEDELISLRIESVDTEIINSAASALSGESIKFIATGQNFLLPGMENSIN